MSFAPRCATSGKIILELPGADVTPRDVELAKIADYVLLPLHAAPVTWAKSDPLAPQPWFESKLDAATRKLDRRKRDRWHRRIPPGTRPAPEFRRTSPFRSLGISRRDRAPRCCSIPAHSTRISNSRIARAPSIRFGCSTP